MCADAITRSAKPGMPAASGAARGAMTKNDPVPKRATRDGAAEAAPSRDASNYALGSCCVMQWMLPPP